MDKKQFITQFKDIYHHTKRGEHDSSYDELRDMLLNDIISKSKGGWDESIALETMRFVEHVFKVQPEATKQALRITSADAEVTFEHFLVDRGYEYTHIAESTDQSPDGYIEGFGARYICEVKSPNLMFDHKETPFGYKFSTTHNKILDAIHKAKVQLERLDPDHSMPHILVYTSAHPQLDYNNFIDAIRGYIANQDGTITTDLRGTGIFKSTRPIIKSIDLYMWVRIGSKGALRVSYFGNLGSVHKASIDRLIEKLNMLPVSSMDVHGNLQDTLDGTV